MFRKIALGVFVFFLLAGTGLYIAINKGLIFPSTSNKEATPTPSATAGEVAVAKKANGFILHGRLATDLKMRSDGNIEGRFILTGDPNQREIKLLLVPLEGLISVGKYQGSFAGSLFVDRLDPSVVEKSIKQGQQVELDVVLSTDKPHQGYETMMKDALDNLATGSWEIPTSDIFIIVTSTVGIIE